MVSSTSTIEDAGRMSLSVRPALDDTPHRYVLYCHKDHADVGCGTWGTAARS